MLPDLTRTNKSRFELGTDKDYTGIYFPQTDTLFLEVEQETIQNLNSDTTTLQEELYQNKPLVYLHEWLHKSLGYFSPVYDLMRKLDDVSNQLLIRLARQNIDNLVQHLTDIWTADRVIQRFCDSWRSFQECYVSAAQCICIGMLGGTDDELEEVLTEAIRSSSQNQREVLRYVRYLNEFLCPVDLFKLVHNSAVVASRPSDEPRPSHIQFLGVSEKDLLKFLEEAYSIIQENNIEKTSENMFQQISREMFDSEFSNAGAYFNEIIQISDSVISYRESLFDRFSQVSPLDIWKNQVHTTSFTGTLASLDFELKSIAERSSLSYTLPPQYVFLESDQDLWWKEPRFNRSPIPLPPLRTTLRHYLLDSLTEGADRITVRQRSNILEILPEYDEVVDYFYKVRKENLLPELRQRRDEQVSQIFN